MLPINNDILKTENEILKTEPVIKNEIKPVIKKQEIKMRKEDIGKDVKTFDQLLINCIKYTGDTSDIAKRLLKAVKDGKICPDDKLSESIKIKNKITEYDQETEKWNKIYKEIKEKHTLKINLDKNIKLVKMNENEFLDKNNKLKSNLEQENNFIQLEEDKIKSKFAHLNTKIFSLVKRIYEVDNDEQPDPILILKAMTRLEE